jgi:hypothetical protein
VSAMQWWAAAWLAVMLLGAIGLDRAIKRACESDRRRDELAAEVTHREYR